MPNKPATVLIVDDEVHVRKLLTTLLQSKGYVTLTAGSGEEALAAELERLRPAELLVPENALQTLQALPPETQNP